VPGAGVGFGATTLPVSAHFEPMTLPMAMVPVMFCAAARPAAASAAERPWWRGGD
jgi:hypothetical protein